MTRTGDDDADRPETVVAVGECRREYDLTTLRTLPRIELRCPITCASGERTPADWAGVPVGDLLADADPPPETTHLRVSSDDGYRACLPAPAAVDCILAYERDGRALAAQGPYPTRFVAPDAGGTRFVKGVTRLETFALDPATDPTSFERLSLEQPEYG